MRASLGSSAEHYSGTGLVDWKDENLGDVDMWWARGRPDNLLGNVFRRH
jgi:hypothetical protein